MARVERLNKTILPQLSDPANIGRQANVAELAEAGGTARLVSQAADVALAFKAAKDATFVAEKSTTLEHDVDTFFRDFKVTAAGDPDGMKPEFLTFIDDRFRELSKDGSQTALTEFTKLRDDIRFKYDGKYDDYALKQNVENFNTSFDNSIKDIAVLGFREGQDGAPLDDQLNQVDMVSLAGTSFIGAPELADLTRTSKSAVAQEWAQGRIENNPGLFRSELNEGIHDDLFTSDQLQSLGNLADAELQDIEREITKEATRVKNERESFIDLQIKTSEGFSDITKAEQAIENSSDELGVIKSNALRAQAFAKRKKLEKEVGDLQLGAQFASGEVQLNPQNTDHKKAYNAFYNSLVPTLDQLPVEERNIADAKIIDNARTVPDVIQGKLSLAARSQNAEEVTAAADLIDRVTSINPHLVGDLGSETELARIQMVNERIDGGFPPSEAIAATDAILDPKNVFSEEAVQEELKTIKKNFDFRKEAFANFDRFSFGIGDPRTAGAFVVPELDGMTARYRNAFEDHYRITRDEKVSKKFADKVIKGQYGNTVVNGFKQVMQFNPEKYYSIAGEKNKWMRKQMIEEAFKATRNTIPLPSRKELEKNLRLVVDPRVTPRSAAAGAPLYKLFWVRDGAPIDVLQGKFFKFDPDERRKQLIKNAK